MRTITKPPVDRDLTVFWGSLRKASLAGMLTSLTLLALLCNPATTTAASAPLNNVNLSWNRSTSAEVTGYRIYYGIASGTYTNSIGVGNATNYTLSNLVSGVTYFFASTAYTASYVESPYSNEALFVPGGAAFLKLTVAANRQAILNLTGQSGHTYEIQSSTTLTTWGVIGSVTVGGSGIAIYTDTTAPSYATRYYRTRDTTP